MLDGMIPAFAASLAEPQTAPKKRIRHGTSKRTQTYSQALQMQQVLFSDAINKKLSPRERHSAALAWERIEERKRIMRGKPAPGSFRPVREPKARRPARRAQADPAPTERKPLTLDCQTDYGTNGQTQEPTPQA